QDVYAIRVYAVDVSGNSYTIDRSISVVGNLQLGRMHLEFTDLQMPVVGIPITLVRIYDSVDAATSGDFGFGWRLGVREGRIRETVPVNPSEQATAFAVNPF